ncbi:hypothetical protein, partial [Klebsiella pneumoniae]|uniref:hypothetical protein n=1 Tax=Klebsiella pneumoniae TaxID=573 RepID=UPI001B8C8AC7
LDGAPALAADRAREVDEEREPCGGQLGAPAWHWPWAASAGEDESTVGARRVNAGGMRATTETRIARIGDEMGEPLAGAGD